MSFKTIHFWRKFNLTTLHLFLNRNLPFLKIYEDKKEGEQVLSLRHITKFAIGLYINRWLEERLDHRVHRDHHHLVHQGRLAAWLP